MIETGLHIVATPIGNLSDMTFRAVETLKQVSFILAEDTRVSKTLMDRYQITTPLVSYRDQNHNKMVEKAIEKLAMGLPLALISDSGTPTISDPGYKLVRDMRAHGFKVITIPGPSAVVAALSISGLPTDRFIFLGFMPKGDSKRLSLLKQYSFLESTLILYESPHRLLDLLNELGAAIGEDRMISVVNNMTKLSEEVNTGSVKEVREIYQAAPTIKGEFVVLISKENKEVS